VYPLRRVGLVVDINPHLLSNSRPQQRAGNLPVISQRRDEVPGRQFNACLADPQDVGWISLRDYSCSRERREARSDRCGPR
jgi:hypothetical protein